MALWRDPLDELIEELDRALPSKPEPDTVPMPSSDDWQFYMAGILYSTEAQCESHPRYQEALRNIERWQEYRQRIDAVPVSSDPPEKPQDRLSPDVENES